MSQRRSVRTDRMKKYDQGVGVPVGMVLRVSVGRIRAGPQFSSKVYNAFIVSEIPIRVV